MRNGVVQCVVGHSVAFHGAVEVDRPEEDLSPLGRVVDAGREDFVAAYAGQDLQVPCVNLAEADGVHLETDVGPVAATDAVGRAVANHVVPLAMGVEAHLEKDVVVLLEMDVVVLLETDAAAHRVGVDHLVIDAEDVEVRLVDAVDHLGHEQRCPAANGVRFEHADCRDHRANHLDGVADRPACVVGHQVRREGQLADDHQLVMDADHSAMNVALLDADRLAAVTYAGHHLVTDAMGRLVQSEVQFVMDAVRLPDVLVVTDVVVVHVEAVAHAMDRAVRVECAVVDTDYAVIVRMLGSAMAVPLGWVPVAVALGCSVATATPSYFSV